MKSAILLEKVPDHVKLAIKLIMNVRNLICLLLVLFSTSNNLLAQTYKIDFDLSYIKGISSNPTSGNFIAIDDSAGLIVLGRAILCKIDYKSGSFTDTLDNAFLYGLLKENLLGTELYKNTKFYDVNTKDDITTCNNYYFQYRRLIRVSENIYATEIAITTINMGIVSVVLYLSDNLDVVNLISVEKTSDVGVAYNGITGQFEKDDILYVQSGLEGEQIYSRETPSFFTRFIKEEDGYYKFDGFLDSATHGKRNLYCPRFFSMFYNKDQPCVSNGWEIFCYSEDLSSLERKIELDIPYEEVYSTIIQVDEDKYLTTRMNLDDIGAAIGDCNIYILDKDFQEEEHLLRFSIVHSYLNSIDYLDGKLYLYLNKLMTGELMLTVIDINQKR